MNNAGWNPSTLDQERSLEVIERALFIDQVCWMTIEPTPYAE